MFNRDWTPAFGRAVDAALADHEEFGDHDLSVIGVEQYDSNQLIEAALETFGEDLLSRDPERIANSVGASMEIALATGVYLERHRWDEYEEAKS